MSKHKNYSKMYAKENEEPKVDTEETCEECIIHYPEDTVEETATVAEEPKTVFGIVSGCKKLNVRTAPDKNSEIAYVVNEDQELFVDLDKSTDEWFRVRNAAGIEGFCMKTFITIKK